MKLNQIFQENSFACTPDWRWQRILQLMESKDRPLSPRRSSKRDDAFVKKGFRFKRFWDGAGTDWQTERLYHETPGLYYAHEFHVMRQQVPTGVAWLEARILANQSQEEIAARMHTIPDTVAWYEALWFDVRRYLTCRDWITAHVLLPAFQLRGQDDQEQDDEDQSLSMEELKERERGVVSRPFMDASQKVLAYFGGPILVDFLIQGMQPGRLLTSLDDLQNWLDFHHSNNLRRRAIQASARFEVNKFNVLPLFEIHAQLMALEKSDDFADQKLDARERCVKAMLEELPYTMGQEAAEYYRQHRPEIAKYDDGPVELRTADLLEAGLGKPINIDIPKELPPPRRNSGPPGSGGGGPFE